METEAKQVALSWTKYGNHEANTAPEMEKCIRHGCQSKYIQGFEFGGDTNEFFHLHIGIFGGRPILMSRIQIQQIMPRIGAKAWTVAVPEVGVAVVNK
eukprot:scaffold18305_cov33-Attheya_sp.AAC.1